MNETATFVLVHGAWQGAWCWEHVIADLERHGHEVIAPDLPGHGADDTPLDTITLDTYVAALTDVVQSASRPVILVGHSMSGFVGLVAARIPRNVAALVYVSAVVPVDGKPLLHVADQIDPEYLAHIRWNDHPRTARLTPDGARKYLFPRSSPDVIARAVPRLSDEPLAPYEVPVEWHHADLVDVPIYYVACNRDLIVRPELQEQMHRAARAIHVFQIDSDHAPFLCAPRELVVCLQTVAARQQRHDPRLAID